MEPTEDAPTERSLDELVERVDLLKKEVDTLQAETGVRKTPWYKTPATIISLAALLFSFGTTAVSLVRTYKQDVQDRRAELRGMLQRLAALPKEGFEVTLQHSDNPVAVRTLGGYFNQENSILARQAAELAMSLPENKVSATELLAVGIALQNSYDMAGARDFSERAVNASRTFNDEISARRTLAGHLFLEGSPESGRREYQRALDIFGTYKGYDADVQVTTHVETELMWASSEMRLGMRQDARQRLLRAEERLSNVRDSPMRDHLLSHVRSAHADLDDWTTPRGPSPPPPPLAAPLVPSPSDASISQ